MLAAALDQLLGKDKKGDENEEKSENTAAGASAAAKPDE